VNLIIFVYLQVVCYTHIGKLLIQYQLFLFFLLLCLGTLTFYFFCLLASLILDSSWNVTAHSDTREGKWRGNWRMEWVASILHTTLEHGVSTITTADAHTLASSSQLNWHPNRFKWTRPVCRKTKPGFCACAITFQLASTTIQAFFFLTLCRP